LDEDSSQFMQLPHVTSAHVNRFEQRNVKTIKDLQALPLNKLQSLLQDTLRTPQHITEFTQVFQNLPRLSLTLTLLAHQTEEEAWTAVPSLGSSSDKLNQTFGVTQERELRLEVTITGAPTGGAGVATGGGVREDKIFSPRYHKSKSISWWLVLGSTSGELLAMKRIGNVGMASHGHPVNHSLLFSSPSSSMSSSSPSCSDYLVFLIPDSVYGIEALGQFHLQVAHH
jgi:hypothetical protein